MFQLLQGYKTRENAIKGCIMEVSETINTLQGQRDRDPDDMQLIKDIRKHQTRVIIIFWLKTTTWRSSIITTKLHMKITILAKLLKHTPRTHHHPLLPLQF